MKIKLARPDVEALISKPIIFFNMNNEYFIGEYHTNQHYYGNFPTKCILKHSDVKLWKYLDEIANNVIEYETLRAN